MWGTLGRECVCVHFKNERFFFLPRTFIISSSFLTEALHISPWEGVCAGAHIQEVNWAPPLTSQWGSRRTHQDPRRALKGPYTIHSCIPSLSNRASLLLCHAVCLWKEHWRLPRETGTGRQEQKHASHPQQGCLLGSESPLGAGHLAEDIGLSGAQPYISQGEREWSQRPLSLQNYRPLCQICTCHSFNTRTWTGQSLIHCQAS